MKNTNDPRTSSWNGKTYSLSTGNLISNQTVDVTWTYKLLSSSTNTTQNIGDFVTGTPYSFTLTKNGGLGGSFSGRNGDGGPSTLRYTNSGSYGSCPLYSPLGDEHETLLSQASNKAIDNLFNQLRGDFDTATVVAEFAQTYEMLRNPLKSLTTLAGNLKKHHRKKAAGSLADANLQFRYGAMPLISDMYSIGANVQRYLKDKPTLYFSKGAATSDGIQDVNISCAGTVLSGQASISAGVYIGMYMRYDLETSRKAQLAADWTSMNPSSILWELTPLSFVVDWVYDLSGYLRNLETACLYARSFKGGWQSRLSLTDCTVRLNKIASANWRASGSANVSGNVKNVAFARTQISLPPKPSLPTINTGSQSWQHLSSAVSLFAQSFSKGINANERSRYRL